MARPVRTLLPVLMLLSGFCGISYEILYAKLLGNLLGDQFTIAASVLLTFLLGIGLGTLHAHRLLRWLWAIEIGIGIYAVAMVLAFDSIDRLIYAWVPALGTSLVACASVSVVLLLVPAFLVGCSVPLFAAYLGAVRSRHVFSVAYGFYNVGAALTVLFLAFVLLHSMGLRAATLLLASLNVLVGLAVFPLRNSVPAAPRQAPWRFDRRVLGALAVASTASAIFQLMMIKIAECFLGPFNETFALVLSAVLIGLALGSWAAMRFGLTFSGAVGIALAGTLALLAFLPLVVGAYAALYLVALQSYLTLAGLKFGLVLAMMALPAIGFGATIPALLVEYRNVARESGQLLFVSSLANVMGFLLMAFFLHRTLAYGQILVVVALLAGSAALLEGGWRNRRGLLAIVLVIAALVAHGTLWDEELLYYGHKKFRSTAMLKQSQSRRFAADSFKGSQDLFAIIHRDGRSYFFINGYISIPLAAASEKIVGAVSTMFAPRTDDALVLGVGSGATAGTVGLLFDRTDAVEINRAVLDNQARMAKYNFDILHQPTVNLIHDDGIHFIKTTPKKYSLILNTVTSPLYFSSSKLYTQDFYENVVTRLRPDGVYTTWIDRDIGDHGVDIILNTLESTFDKCWMTFIKSSYYLMVCSNAEMGLHQLEAVQENETLREFLATNHGLLLDLVPYSILSTDAFRMKGQVTPINRLERPVLEHHMARIDGEIRLFRLSNRLTKRADLNQVKQAVSPWFAWEPAGFALWADSRLGGSTLLHEAIERILETGFGDLTARYERVAVDVARKAGTAEAYQESGYRLYKRGQFHTAIDLLSQALTLDPENHQAHYYRGRCREKLGETALAALDFEAALRIRPNLEKAEEGLDRVRNDGPSG